MLKAVGALKSCYTQTVRRECGGASGKPRRSPVKQHHDYSGVNVAGNYIAVADEFEEFSNISFKHQVPRRKTKNREKIFCNHDEYEH